MPVRLSALLLGCVFAMAAEAQSQPAVDPTLWQELCARRTATAAERLDAALKLQASGRLADAVVQNSCSAEGARTGLLLLLKDVRRVCPGPRCFRVLLRARIDATPELEAAMKRNPEAVAWGIAASTEAGPLRFAQTLALPVDASEALSKLVAGERVPVDELATIASDRIASVLISRAPPAPGSWAVSRELRGEPAEPRAFRSWIAAAACDELHRTFALIRSGEQRDLLFAQRQRCPDIVQKYLILESRKLDPREVLRILHRATAEEVRIASGSFGLEEPARAEVLLPTILETGAVGLPRVQVSNRLLDVLTRPPNLAKVGGRRRLVDLLLGDGVPALRWGEELWPRLWPLAVAEADTPHRVRILAGQKASEERRSELDAVVRGKPPLMGAAAAGYAQAWAWHGAKQPSLSREGAGACQAELERFWSCAAGLEAKLGPVPPGPRMLEGPKCGVGPDSAPPPAPIEVYCSAHDEALRSCPGVCGGPLPPKTARELIAKAAGREFAEPAGMRACTW